jgi:hypothetical protein
LTQHPADEVPVWSKLERFYPPEDGGIFLPDEKEVEEKATSPLEPAKPTMVKKKDKSTQVYTLCPYPFVNEISKCMCQSYKEQALKYREQHPDECFCEESSSEEYEPRSAN